LENYGKNDKIYIINRQKQKRDVFMRIIIAGCGAVGPYGNYAAYSSFAKLVLSALMLLGRLEIFPMLLVFTPVFWKAK
jgi:trk system potassium uptake protein TrkH